MSAKSSESPSQPASADRRAFVVLGMHRSGTSAMTRTLSLLGARLPEQLMPAAANNPSGHWEPQLVADFNDEILQAQDSEWDDVFGFRRREYLSNFDRFYVGRATELLRQQFDGAEVIVLKDPRISVLTAFWDRALSEAGYTIHYIIMVRNPLEVAESLRARDGFPREKSFLLWSSYMIAIDRDTRKRVRTFVSYDQLMNDWRSVRQRIEAMAGVPFPRDSAAAAIDVDRHLDGGLRHHKIPSVDFFARADVPEQLKTLYQIFEHACEGRDVDSVAVDTIEAELSKMDQLVGPVVADLKFSARMLGREVAALKDARAGAENRVIDLTEQFEGERIEHGRILAEMEIRITTLEGERSRLTSELEGKQLALEEAQARLRESELELVSRKADSDALAAQIKIAAVDLESAKGRLTDSEFRIDELVRSRDQLHSAKAELEERLSSHFQETSTLSRMILESQELAAKESEKIRRIRQLYDAVAAQPRWWSILSRLRRSHLQQARLSRLGVFNAEAYLRANPDVAAAGEDPLHHYLHHGIDEQRPTEFGRR